MRRPTLLPIRTLSARARGEFYRRADDRFVRIAPNHQTAIESVSVAWASRLPLTDVVTGDVSLFDDERVTWAVNTLGGVEGATCIELGPLEGGHSYMLEHAGAKRVTAVEANKDAYLKCLIVKELLDMSRCSFLCGDVTEYLAATDEHFDVCWCAGVLYHMVDPVRLLALISQRAERLYIWTHYYDRAKLAGNSAFAQSETTSNHYNGFTYDLHRQRYGVATRFRGFWGGTHPYSNWLTLSGLLAALEHFGWHEVHTRLDEDHPHGPAVDVVATRK